MARELWKHQEIALNKYKDKEYCGILFPCGTGKTKVAIALAEEKERPVIVIAPNVLCKQWKEDIEEDKTKEWDIQIVTSKEKKKKGFKETFDLFCRS